MNIQKIFDLVDEDLQEEKIKQLYVTDEVRNQILLFEKEKKSKKVTKPFGMMQIYQISGINTYLLDSEIDNVILIQFQDNTFKLIRL